ncbi:hypothetical protein [Chitinimonas lacunae]|uniref:Lipoprotein n=1 Tax=Chitinimonas lacunae TaxID=1963018 RepID=A0ABV8MMX7_9NEIS
MRISLLPLCLLPLALSACGTLRPYVEPTDGPTSRITFTVPRDTSLASTIVSYEDPVECARMQTIKDIPQETVTRTVPAGQEFAFTVTHLTARGHCKITLSFVPETGQFYRFQSTYNRHHGRCYANLKQEKPGNGQILLEPVKADQRDDSRKFWHQNSPICHPKKPQNEPSPGKAGEDLTSTPKSEGQ